MREGKRKRNEKIGKGKYWLKKRNVKEKITERSESRREKEKPKSERERGDEKKTNKGGKE